MSTMPATRGSRPAPSTSPTPIRIPNPALLRQAIEVDTEGHATPALADALAGTVGRVMAWLRQEGARIINVPIQGTNRWRLAPPRTWSAGLDWQGRGPDILLQTLAANLAKRGGTLLRGAGPRAAHRGRALYRGGGAPGGRALDVKAASAVLADGGFQGNPQLVQRFISPRPDCLTQRSAGTGRGDALMMAEAAGARLTDARSFYGHLLAADSLHNPGLWPYPTMDTLVGGAIMVDRSGRRFLDEGLGGIALSNALARWRTRSPRPPFSIRPFGRAPAAPSWFRPTRNWWRPAAPCCRRPIWRRSQP